MNQKLWSTLIASCAVFTAPSVVQAGGYDTPILYSARHIGMAGTGVSSVSDGTALFLNPAGLANIDRGSVIADFSLLLGTATAPIAGDVEAEPTVGPFFLVGGGYRVIDHLTIGAAVYPVTSAGATFLYGAPEIQNETELVFIEASPGLAVDLPGGVNLGIGYRITYASLYRFAGNDAAKTLDFDMSGVNFAGLRLGAQWAMDLEGQGDPRISVGAHYRHKTVTELTADEGFALTDNFEDLSIKFTLPSRFSFGARFDIFDFGVALDAEYALNSQNKGYPLEGTSMVTGQKASVANYFRWTDAWTLRGGFEYRLLKDQLPVRVGYIWDQKTANEKFPNAFGTPPGPSHIGTCGVGWNMKHWSFNAAYAYRTAQGEVTPEDVAAGREEVDPDCLLCNGPGDYELSMHGIYVDASYSF